MTREFRRTGFLCDDLPYLRIGGGDDRPRLFVFPGVGDALYDLDYLAQYKWPLRAFLERSYKPLTDKYDIWIVGRRRNLPHDATTEAMAERYMEAIDSQGGKAHVRGESMGGMIAQHLAARYPDAVTSLTLVATAHRVSDHAAATMDQWASLARARKWNEVYSGMASYLYAGERGESAGRFAPLAKAFGLNHHPDSPSDFLISLASCVRHRSFSQLAMIPCPTLVIGGEQDRLFPPTLLTEMVGELADARLVVLQDAAHGVNFERKKEFDDAQNSFLLER
ncbi:MAG: alpha/beta fold hydrolase [Planctomycetota bacterium]|jgi:pimeloyl-ACP methyl ester carboxylesterase